MPVAIVWLVRDIQPRFKVGAASVMYTEFLVPTVAVSHLEVMGMCGVLAARQSSPFMLATNRSRLSKRAGVWKTLLTNEWGHLRCVGHITRGPGHLLGTRRRPKHGS